MKGISLAVGWILMMVINFLAFMHAVFTYNNTMAFVTVFTLVFNILALLKVDKDRNKDRDN